MKENKNFYNEYTANIKAENRERALALFNKMSDADPGLMQNCKVKIIDKIDGGLFIYIGNTSAFEKKVETVIKTYLNSLRESI
jgi:hypothetical protein